MPPAALRLPILLLASQLVACGQEQANDAQPPSAVIGISADSPLAERIDRVAVRLLVDGAPHAERQLSALPGEVEVASLATHTPISATVEAFDTEGRLLVRRIISTDVVVGRTLLLRARLQDECLIAEAAHDVSCVGLTCQAGTCEVPYVGPHRLEDYTPGWAETQTGACGLVGDGEPSVTIGKPEPPFTAFVDGETVVPQQGLQGASHFFLAVRMQGADPSTARTITRGTIVSSGRETNAVTVGDPYDDDCSLFMIPFVLPPDGTTDETMRLEVTVFDHTENAGHAEVDLHLAQPLPP